MKRPALLLFAVLVPSLIGCYGPAPANNSATLVETEPPQKVLAPTVPPNLNINQANQAAEDKESPNADFAGTVGVTDKKNDIKASALLSAVRTAQHQGFDRIVFEFAGAELPGYHIEYIDKPVRQCGSGETVTLGGDAWLEIRFSPANAHTEQGTPTITNRRFSANHKIVKELASTCDFEADVSWVAGLASPNRYRVMELKNPTRLSVDVKH